MHRSFASIEFPAVVEPAPGLWEHVEQNAIIPLQVGRRPFWSDRTDEKVKHTGGLSHLSGR